MVCVRCGVWCDTLKKRPRVNVPNVAVYASTTRTHVSTCERGASIHWKVLNVHTETFWTDTRGLSACHTTHHTAHTPQHKTQLTRHNSPDTTHKTQHNNAQHNNAQHNNHHNRPHHRHHMHSHTQHNSSPKFAHVGLSRASEVHQNKHWILHIFSLKIDREQDVADSSNHSLYLRETS